MGTEEGRALGERIAALRVRARLSRRELGALAHVSHAYIGKLERGEIEYPSGARLDAIARALGWENYHALLGSASPTPPAAAEAGPDAPVRQWERMLAELRELLLRAEAREATLRRLYLAVLERDHGNGGPAAGAAG